MSGIKRFCLIVFGLCGALCLCGLALPWMGPYQREATQLLSNGYYFAVLQCATAVTALGLVLTLLRGLFTPPRRKTVVISKDGGDTITVTANAISSQATHVVEASGPFVAEKVRVVAKRRGNVTVDLRVRPSRTVNLEQEGQHLRDALAGGLRTICGDRVKHINIQFVEALANEDELTVEPEPEGPQSLEVPASVYEHAAQQQADITVPVAAVTHSDAASADEPLEPSSIELEGEVA